MALFTVVAVVARNWSHCHQALNLFFMVSHIFSRHKKGETFTLYRTHFIVIKTNCFHFTTSVHV